jgi:hypothetical protein
MSEMLNDNVGAEVQPTASKQPFRSFETQEDFDNFSAHLIKKTEEKVTKSLKADLEVAIREQLKKEAEMSEAEKLASERQKMQAEFREERIELNKEKARNLLANAGFEDNEMEVYLDFVTEDKDVSLGKIMRVCESRKASQEKLLSKWQNELQTANPNVNIGKNQSITAEKAKNMSIKERTELKRTNPALYDALFKS